MSASHDDIFYALSAEIAQFIVDFVLVIFD